MKQSKHMAQNTTWKRTHYNQQQSKHIIRVPDWYTNKVVVWYTNLSILQNTINRIKKCYQFKYRFQSNYDITQTKHTQMEANAIEKCSLYGR